MITIHHLSASRSERVIWLMEELGLEYRLEPFQREANGAAPPPMKALHALGKAPVIHDGDTVLAYVDAEIGGRNYFAGSEFTTPRAEF